MKDAATLEPDKDIVAVGRELIQERETYREIAPWLGKDPDVAYLLGSLIGDGCLTTSGIAIATGRERDHLRFVAWAAEKLPSVRVHGYFHGRCWYVSLSHPQLLSMPGYGNRKTRLHHFLETHGLKTRAQRKRVRNSSSAAIQKRGPLFWPGFWDADGCTAVTSKGSGTCFLTSTSRGLLQDVRRLSSWKVSRPPSEKIGYNFGICTRFAGS